MRWREIARAFVPELGDELDDPSYSLYLFFMDLLPMVREAHIRGDDGLLDRAYGYAAWCSQQDEDDVWNAAGVCFYEHLFNDWTIHQQVLERLSADVIVQHWGLWEASLDAKRLSQLSRLVERMKGLKLPSRKGRA